MQHAVASLTSPEPSVFTRQRSVFEPAPTPHPRAIRAPFGAQLGLRIGPPDRTRVCPLPSAFITSVIQRVGRGSPDLRFTRYRSDHAATCWITLPLLLKFAPSPE